MSRLLLPLLIFSVFFYGCDSSVLWRSHPYAVVRIDAKTSLYYELGQGGYIQRVSGEISSVGINDDFISVKKCDVRPCTYFYINKSKDNKFEEPDDVAKGPFYIDEYMEKSKVMNLPSLNEFKVI